MRPPLTTFKELGKEGEAWLKNLKVVMKEIDALMDAVTLKFSRFGGITPIRRARDLTIQLGFAMTIEDSAGGDIVSAAMAQIGATIPDDSLINGSLIGRMVEQRIATDWSPLDGGGFGTLPSGSGLGISIGESRLGMPVLTFG